MELLSIAEDIREKMTITRKYPAGIERLIITSPIGEAEERVIGAGAYLLSELLPRDKAIDVDSAIDGFTDPQDPTYTWMVDSKINPGKKPIGRESQGVVVYSQSVKVPHTNAAIGVIWYAIGKDSHRKQVGSMLENALAQIEAANQNTERTFLGILADDVGVEPLVEFYKQHGFSPRPYLTSVSSIEDGKEKEIAGNVRLLFRPSKEYEKGLPITIEKRMNDRYLWTGYECARNYPPAVATRAAIDQVAVRDNRKLIIPFS